jgi:tetratricopeptide (TPR) repeat protein
MAYQEDQRGKLRRQSSKQAITLAMEGRWQESIEVNRGILQNFPNDVDAYNRLGKAYVETGDYTKAKEAYTRALQLDQYNTIAKKNLQRLAHLGDSTAAVPDNNSEKAEPHIFIEEIGKAGVLNLYQIAPAERLMAMMAGNKVVLKSQGASLAVENLRGEYLGLVPSKQGQRLLKLMAGGNKYTAAIVAASENAVSVIIRETYQDPSQTDQISFPGKRMEEIQPYVSDRVFRSEYEEGEEIGEGAPFEEIIVSPEEVADDTEDDKEWEQEV